MLEWYYEFIKPGIILLIAACILGIVAELALKRETDNVTRYRKDQR